MRIALVLLGLAVAVRVALPTVLRRVIVSQANAAIAGRLEVGDVDLWLVLGGAGLTDVALRAEGAAPADPPLVAFHRLYVQVGWFSLLRRTLRVKDFALDGLALNADRLQSGALVLPKLREGPPKPEPKPEAKPAPPGKPWNIVIDRAALRDGHLRLRDYVVEPPEPVELVLAALELKGFTFQYGPGSEPGHGVVEARFADGTVRVETTVATRSDGFAVDARVEVTNLPLDRTQVHVPALGWSGFRGRLDAALTAHVEPGANPVLGGTLALRDLAVEVPGGEEPALAWRRLDLDVETLDAAARHARVRRVALDGAAVLVRPREKPPLPLLAGHPSGTASPPPAPPAEGTPPGAPWTWSVTKLEVSDTLAKVFLEPPPLEIRIVKATVTDLSSAAGSTAAVALEVREGDGTIALDGTIGLDPLAAHLTARLDRLALGRLVAATGAAPVLLPGGALGGQLTIAAEHPALVVSGQLALADLQVAPREGQDFSLAWKQLDLGIREIRVPGVLPGEPVAPTEPLRIDLERLRLSNPSVALTRTSEGIVLPAAGAPAAAATPPPSAAPSPPPADASGRPLALTLANLDLDGGQISVLDRTTKPFYQGRVAAIRLAAHGLGYPENVFDDFALSLRAPGNAPLSIKGTRSGGRIRLDASGDRIPLTQFNPYVTASGYSIARGAASFGSRARWETDRYDSETTLRLASLDVAGAQGDSLFAQHFGVPLTLALGLMRDVHGVIALTIPVSGDRRSGAQVGVGAVIAEALRHAIVNALASPLRLIGAVAGGGDKVDATPEPIACAPGKPEVTAEARTRVEQLGTVLGGAPALRLELTGSAGGPDVRALQEAAILAELSADKGALGTLRNLASRGTRSAIREALAARASGKSGELPPELAKTLDDWAAQRTISDGALHALAAARAARLQSLLVQDYGIPADRLALGEPAVDREAGRPAVAIALAAGH
ncbi:MAG TPA: DUF748 domain-containing protein [Verrucomicrobiae bacterium]|nr:DUF748 domain-containing protein [Verrucomicrobiae bacterium]